MRTTCRITLRAGAVLTAAAIVLGVPSAAHAWWRGGVVFGFAPPLFVPPPVNYGPPPAYYGPPPDAYAPAYAPAPTGQACYAGPYVCPLDNPTPVGGPCSCPTNNNGRAGGRVG